MINDDAVIYVFFSMKKAKFFGDFDSNSNFGTKIIITFVFKKKKHFSAENLRKSQIKVISTLTP
jgi:hypothetical protein